MTTIGINGNTNKVNPTSAVNAAETPNISGLSEGRAKINIFANEYQPDENKTPAKPMPTPLSMAEFRAGFKPPKYLVDGMLQEGYLGILVALWGAGKTSILTRLSSDVSHGSLFCGRRTKQKKVLFLAGENPDDTRMRFMGLEGIPIETKNGPLADADGNPVLRTNENVYVIAGTFDIEKNITELLSAIENIGDIGLVVIDTLAAYNTQDDENDARMGRFINALRPICEAPSAPAVIIAAHPKKSPTRDNIEPRGSGAIIAEVDYVTTLWKTDNSANVVEMAPHPAKFRGMPFKPVNFQLKAENHPLFQPEFLGDQNYTTVAAHYMPFEQSKEIKSSNLAVNDALLKYVHENQWATNVEIGKAIGCHPNHASRVAGQLKKDGMLDRERGKQFKLTRNGKKHVEALAVAESKNGLDTEENNDEKQVF